MLLNDRLNKDWLGGTESGSEIQDIREWNQNEMDMGKESLSTASGIYAHIQKNDPQSLHFSNRPQLSADITVANVTQHFINRTVQVCTHKSLVMTSKLPPTCAPCVNQLPLMGWASRARLGIIGNSLSLLWDCGCGSLDAKRWFQSSLWRATIKREVTGAPKLDTIKPGIIKAQMVLACLHYYS